MPKSKQKKENKKVQYFRVDKFVSSVITAMELGKVKPELQAELENSIAERLGDRIMFTVINSFRDRELIMFDNMLKDHPELDELDVLWLVANQMEGLKDHMEREINSLYAELVYDAEKIGEVLNSRKEKSHK